MITENLSTLKIHKLSQAQYDREKEAGNLDETALYLTPDTEVDLSGYATKDELSTYIVKENPTGTGSFSMNRLADSTVGGYSTALGYNCTASNGGSLATGYNCVASGGASLAAGHSSVASGTDSFATGNGSTASQVYSVAMGNKAEANGNTSISLGCNTIASGDYSFAEGYYTTALKSQHIQGHYNNTTNTSAGSTSGTAGTAFVIGNGTSSATSNACRITYDGAVIGKAAYQSTGADYAEYFEWADGNTENEERIGYFVTFDDGEFIRKANEGEYILGIVSGNPAVLGNNDECWRGQNEMDEWNRFIYVTETGTNEETGETYEYQTYKVNPNYDNTIRYIPRADRPEWDAVGMLGVLSVRDDGTCQVNGYCKVADGGIATASDVGYRVIKRVTDNIVKVVFR